MRTPEGYEKKEICDFLTERGAYLALVLDDLVKKCEAAEASLKSPKQEAPPAHAAPEPAPAKEARHESAEKK